MSHEEMHQEGIQLAHTYLALIACSSTIACVAIYQISAGSTVITRGEFYTLISLSTILSISNESDVALTGVATNGLIQARRILITIMGTLGAFIDILRI